MLNAQSPVLKFIDNVYKHVVELHWSKDSAPIPLIKIPEFILSSTTPEPSFEFLEFSILPCPSGNFEVEIKREPTNWLKEGL